MIQPETSREDIRELKRFNKTEPAAGVADDISQLVEKFYQDNELILNAVYGEEFDEQTINRFTEIVNPAGNRSYKKGLYFMMMYENRVTFKKFGDTPKDMTWWEFYQLTREIFDDTAAGPKTWQNHFGGADDEETTVQDTADEPGREETATEAPEPRMTVEQLEKLALMMSRRSRKETWKIMEQLTKQEQDKRKMTPMEKKAAKQIVKNLQRGPMNRQERRAERGNCARAKIHGNTRKRGG